MKPSFLFLFLWFAASTLQAQDAVSAADKETAYIKTITTRAEKIVAPLNIADAAKRDRVTKLVAGQYRILNEVYTKRDEQVKAVKQNTTDKEALTTATKAIDEATTTAVAAAQKIYLKNLSAELTEDQIVQIKDGMTYGVLPITYRGYQDMLPKLTTEQKDQIMKWLVEARDFAMSAESSEKKHGWFGKYKGRINNYLAAAGYDLNKESKDWHQRMKDRETAKKAEKQGGN